MARSSSDPGPGHVTVAAAAGPAAANIGRSVTRFAGRGEAMLKRAVADLSTIRASRVKGQGLRQAGSLGLTKEDSHPGQ
jgi:hypothetical protein